MNRPRRVSERIVTSGFALILLAAVSVHGSEALVFDLEEASAVDLAKLKSAFRTGLRCLCSEAADAEVTAYPVFASQKPLYGSVRFGSDPHKADSGTRFCFAVDESGGTDKGYDRLYFDANRNLDLTDDGVLARVPDPPGQMLLSGASIQQQACFECIGIPLTFGSEGTRPLEVMPRLIVYEGDRRYVAFVTTKGRFGKITVAGQTFDVLLGHNNLIAGWFDHPQTALHLIGPSNRDRGYTWWSGDRLMAIHKIGHTFYRFAATPAGDKLTVRPHDGPLGTLEVGPADRNVRTMAMRGSLQSEDTAVPVGNVLNNGTQEPTRLWRLPVGDYAPRLLDLEYGDLRITLSNNYHADGRPRGGTTRPPVYGIEIRADKPFVFDFFNTPEVMFAQPAKGQRVRRGEQLTIKAVLIDPVLDFMIRGLSYRREGGPSVSLAPKVTIARANGTAVAEGALPFG
ncbi:MAG: hypothetical protein JW993_19470 [Sedimentisphaerales bacterium]|nr:hypothetical protein [Sedimentisphaerales bacterium]